MRKHGEEFIQQKWASKEFQDLLTAVRRQVRRDRRTNEEIPALAESGEPMEAQQRALFENVMWCLDNKHETAAHYKFKFAIYLDGYEKGVLSTHVYTDVAVNMRRWHEWGIKLYIFSNAWSKSQQAFMKQTNHGNLFDLITGYYDTTDIGPPTDPASFTKLLTTIGLPGEEVVFLTKGAEEGNAAKSVGIHSILVVSHQHQLKRYAEEDLRSFERLRSFDELVLRGHEDVPPSTDPGAPQEHTPDGGIPPPQADMDEQ